MNAKDNMKMITIFVPPAWIPMLDTLVDLGHGPNRSELMRTAIKTYLEKYETQLQGVGYNNVANVNLKVAGPDDDDDE